MLVGCGASNGSPRSRCSGFSVVHGHVGYLREAYHGGPYVTKYLVAEAFVAKEHEAAIPAKTLRERLPIAVLMHIYRENKLYGGGKDPARIDEIQKLSGVLAGVFNRQVPDTSHEEFARALNAQSIKAAKALIAGGVLSDSAKAFVNFVELCERKERQTGQPCTIVAS
jgi:hypothetical protein